MVKATAASMAILLYKCFAGLNSGENTILKFEFLIQRIFKLVLVGQTFPTHFRADREPFLKTGRTENCLAGNAIEIPTMYFIKKSTRQNL